MVGKGENGDNQDFLHFPQCFQKASSLRPLKRDWTVNNYQVDGAGDQYGNYSNGDQPDKIVFP